MSAAQYRVTIKDITAWAVEVTAADSIAAERAAWRLFDSSKGRGAFERDEDTTVQVEEVGHE